VFSGNFLASGQPQAPTVGNNSCSSCAELQLQQLQQPLQHQHQQQRRGRLEATTTAAHSASSSCSPGRHSDRNHSPMSSSRSPDAARSVGRTSLLAETASSRQKQAERRPHSAGPRLAIRSSSRGEVNMAAKTRPRTMVHIPRGTTPIHTPRGGLSANCSAGSSSSSSSSSNSTVRQLPHLGRVVRASNLGARDEPSKPVNSRWQGPAIVRAPNAVQVPAFMASAPAVVPHPSAAGLLASRPQSSPRSLVGRAVQSASTSRPSSPAVAASAVARATSPASVTSVTSASVSSAGASRCSNPSQASGLAAATVAVADVAPSMPTVRPPGQAATVRQSIVAKLDSDGHQLPEWLAGESDSCQAWKEPASLLPCLSPLSPIREVAESAPIPVPAVHAEGADAAGTGSSIEVNAGLDHLNSCAARIQVLGGGVRARVPEDANGWPLQESNIEKPVQSSKERYWQIRERFLSK